MSKINVLKDAIKRYQVNTLVARNIKEDFLGGGGPPVILAFNMQRQVQTQWCWAATSTSVSLFYNSSGTWTQCMVAQQTLGFNCCQNASPCNKPWYLDKALTVTNNFVAQSAALSFQDVEAELLNGRVIGVRIGWQGGGGHFMVIYGCKTMAGVNYFSIDDPIYGKSELTENAFSNAYQGAGTWTHSFTTKS
jgi:hypothetical protein